MHKDFMLACLQQAWINRGQCAPNPSVGAVAVYKNKIIAKASHPGVGHWHAEKLILDKLPPKLYPVTLYVTLEPCNHWGRTPPCVEAIVQYGIAKVVYGFTDPNPVVKQKKGMDRLKENNISVIHLPLPEIDAFYQSYAYWLATKKPFVTAKIAHSLNGKISGAQGKKLELTNANCHKFTHKNRKASDVILTSARTIYYDDPQLNARLNHQHYYPKNIAIIDANLTLSGKERIFKTAKRCHIYYQSSKAIISRNNCDYYSVENNPSGGLNLHQIIEHLGSLGYHDLWLEAGGILFSAFHQLNLVQRTYIYIAPTFTDHKGFSAYPTNDNFFSWPHVMHWLIKDNNIIACINWSNH